MLPRHRRTALALVAALAPLTFLASGCGASAAEARRADRAVYETEFARVWNAVSETVKEQYPRLVIEDPVRGKLLTDWHLVERVEHDQVAHPTRGVTGSGTPMGQQGPGGTQVGGQYIPIAGRFFRIVVVIKPGGPPWRLEIDGEAALYQPGMAMIQPYDHADADEPSWVRPRIEKIKVGIYQRLEPFARIREEKPAGPKQLDKGPWANLPAGAPDVVAAVNDAAARKDTSALRRHMSEDFTWSAGGAPSADVAVTMWSADPLVLTSLTRVLAAGCSERETDTLIVCPARAEAAKGAWRAEFRKVGAAWRFAAFFQEE